MRILLCTGLCISLFWGCMAAKNEEIVSPERAQSKRLTRSKEYQDLGPYIDEIPREVMTRALAYSTYMRERHARLTREEKIKDWEEAE